MKIIIHRGTKQIGGCITEIKTDNGRIFIDMGEELPGAGSLGDFWIDGVTAGRPDCDAIFITHYHGDHAGLYRDVLPGIPIFMGEVARELFLALSTWIKDDGAEKIRSFKTFKALDRIVVKDMVVTPLLVDHSAFDAYMFLIESGGRRILHTGDFRLHGFRGKALIPTLEKYVGTVDVLITEGTSLSRDDRTFVEERELKANAQKILAENKYTFVLCSSMNIDRIAALYHATPKRKYFICDSYQKDILDIVTSHAKDRTSLYNFQKVTVYGSNLEDRFRECGFCMLVRSNDYFSRVMQKYPDAKFLYSMWDGYRSGKYQNDEIARFIADYNFISFHTSGHASRDAIEAVCRAVSPKIGIIPIHSEAPRKLEDSKMDYAIKYLQDKEEFNL
ncbi:MAG: MBL fold metallo-hydrolase [Synergistaceae bacterium]|nr:MBL fold metallo-hydrolase [Synergistaceae bacterium]